MLGDHAFQPSRAAFLESPVSILERFGVKQLSDAGAFYQMTKSALAVLEMDRAQVIAVQRHQIERPHHEIVLDALVHVTVQPLEPIRVDELLSM